MSKFTQQNTAQMEKILSTSSSVGLSQEAVSARRNKFGKNLVFPEARTSFFCFLLFLLRRPTLYLVLVSLVFSFLFLESWYVPLAVGGIYIAFLAVCYFMYRYAEVNRRMLSMTASANVTVIREGKTLSISPEELVIGDLLALSPGDVIYAPSQVVSDEDIEVFCKREGFHETLIKHGGACFDAKDEPFNLLCVGDVVRAGNGRAFVTEISETAPKIKRGESGTERTQARLSKLALRLSASIVTVTVLVAVFLTMRSQLSSLASLALCAASCLLSPLEWSGLLYECVFLAENRKIRSKKQALFTSMRTVEDVAETGCFLLPTRSVFQGSRFVVRAFESGGGIRIGENSNETTPELALISTALLAIHGGSSSTVYEKYLMGFCKRHKDDSMHLKMSSLLVSAENLDASIAGFRSEKDGRSFSFVGGDPEALLPYVLCISEDGRTRILDDQTRNRLLMSVKKMKRDGHRLVAYAETQTRVSGSSFPYLSRDMKLLGFFVLSELPDSRIESTLKWIDESGKKAFFFHDGEDPGWITDALPLLKNAPIIDGHAENFDEEVLAFASDKTVRFAVGIHLSSRQKSFLAHALEKYSYKTLAYGETYDDHRLMCASSVAAAPFKEKGRMSVGVVQETATLYAKEHIASSAGCVVDAKRLRRSFSVCTAYFCASLLARCVLLLFGVACGRLLLAPISFALLSTGIDLLAFFCLSHVQAKGDDAPSTEEERRSDLGFFSGALLAAVTIGALSLWMYLFPSAFRFSYASFCFVSLLLMLNVGVLRFSSARVSLWLLLFPVVSIAVSAGFLLLNGVQGGYPYIVAEFPFWALLPTVVMIGMGKMTELLMQRKARTSAEKDRRSNQDSFDNHTNEQ